MGCDLRRWNIFLFLVCTTDLDILRSFSHRVKFYSIIFMFKISIWRVCVQASLVYFSHLSKDTWYVETRKKVRNDNLLGQSRLQTRLWLRSCRSPSREIPHFLHCQTHSRDAPEEHKHRKKFRPVLSKHWQKVQFRNTLLTFASIHAGKKI